MSAYTDYREYLGDCLRLVELLKERSSRTSRDPGRFAEEEQRVREMQAEMRRRVRETREEGKVRLPLEEVCEQYGLDDDERVLLMVLIFVELTGHQMSASEILRILAAGLLERVPYVVQHVTPTSRLARLKLVTIVPERFGGGNVQLEQPAAERLIGIPYLQRTRDEREKRQKVRSVKCAPARTLTQVTPRVLYEEMRQWVIGQDRALRLFCASVYSHLRRVELNRFRAPGEQLQKSNIMLIGPTGCGKTHLVKTMARLLDLPVVCCDASQYTETGYVGSDVEEMLLRLWEAARPDQDPSRGIIFIDEFDKLAARDCSGGHRSQRDVSGAGVQQDLLKLIEGDQVHYAPRSVFSSRDSSTFPVRDILFIAGGAFAGLDEIVRRRLERQRHRVMGFVPGQDAGVDSARGEDDVLDKTTVQDLEEYGIIPEVAGRFPVIVRLESMDQETLVRVMTEPRNSLRDQYAALLQSCGVPFELDRAQLERIAAQALQRKTGARGLRASLEEYCAERMFEAASVAVALENLHVREPQEERGEMEAVS